MRITIKNLQKIIPVNPERIRKAVLEAISREGLRKSAAVTICIVNDNLIQDLNKRFLNEDSPTDVLAFELGRSRSEITADIAVSAQTAVRNAQIYKTTPEYELYLYVVHGILHILGYDDKSEEESNFMQKKAERILAALNISKNAHP